MQAELRQNLEMVDFYNKPSILISALKSITPSLQSNNMTDYFFLKEDIKKHSHILNGLKLTNNALNEITQNLKILRDAGGTSACSGVFTTTVVLLYWRRPEAPNNCPKRPKLTGDSQL
jgi:hypothetical protein